MTIFWDASGFVDSNLRICLIVGETKIATVEARLIHGASTRSANPFFKSFIGPETTGDRVCNDLNMQQKQNAFLTILGISAEKDAEAPVFMSVSDAQGKILPAHDIDGNILNQQSGQLVPVKMFNAPKLEVGSKVAIRNAIIRK